MNHFLKTAVSKFRMRPPQLFVNLFTQKSGTISHFLVPDVIVPLLDKIQVNIHNLFLTSDDTRLHQLPTKEPIMIKHLALLCCLIFLPLPAAAQDANAPLKNIVFETNLGSITIELFDDQAPKTTENFRNYVRESFYDGLIFHRVIPGFVVQAGGFEPAMKRRAPTHPAVVNEATNGLRNKRGTLSMARTSDVNSATSQFFINVADNASLDHRSKRPAEYGYAVFGKVVKGMDTVDKIVNIPTKTRGGFRDVPGKDIIILKAYEE